MMISLKTVICVPVEELKASGTAKLSGEEGQAVVRQLRKFGITIRWIGISPPTLEVEAQSENIDMARLRLQMARSIIEGFLTESLDWPNLINESMMGMRDLCLNVIEHNFQKLEENIARRELSKKKE